MGAPEEMRGLAAQNDWFVEAVLTRPPRDPIETKEPLSSPTAHRKGADHRRFTARKVGNFDYDHKRKIISPQFVQVPVPGSPGMTAEHINADTVPWQTVAEFNEYRALFEKWRFSGEGEAQDAGRLGGLAAIPGRLEDLRRRGPAN